MKHLDKNSLKHFGICFALSLFGEHGAACAVGAAATKEWCDKDSYGHWCWVDIAVDALGIICGYTLNKLIF